MKSLRLAVAAIVAVWTFSILAHAADPSGSWKWAMEFNGQSFEFTAKLDYKDGKLTGTIISPRMGEQPFTDGSFKDGMVAFNLAPAPDRVMKYRGKLEGDSITGSSDFPDFGGGGPTKTDWKAVRVKAEKESETNSKAANPGANPSGNWKWTLEFNGQPFDSTAKFDFKDGKLTGTMALAGMGEFPITEGSFKDGMVAYTVSFDGDLVVKYHGKLEGDSITGSMDLPDFNGGGPMKLNWKATRVK